MFFKKQDEHKKMFREVQKLGRKNFREGELFPALREVCGTKYTYNKVDVYAGRKWIVLFYHRESKVLVAHVVFGVLRNQLTKAITIKDYT